MLPKCIECKHCGEDYIKHPQHGLGKVYICKNPDYTHVVTGKFLPCEQVRALDFFCTYEGKGFEKKEEQLNVGKVVVA